MLNSDASIEIPIHDLGIHGEGIGKLDGYTIFVPGALPGERVSASIRQRKASYAVASLKEILSPSPFRIKPVCPVFGKCGGCQIMHLEYSEQVRYKRQRVADAMQRIGGHQIEVASCEPASHPLSYRNKIQLPIVYSEGSLKLGLFALNTHEIVPIDRCYIHCDLGEKIFESIKKLIANSFTSFFEPVTNKNTLRYLIIKSAIHSNEVMVIFVSSNNNLKEFQKIAKQIINQFPQVVSIIHNYNPLEGNVILGKKFTTIGGKSFIEENFKGFKIRLNPPSFFQVNTWQAEKLYEKAIELAELKQDDIALDLYCGVGMLSLLMAAKVQKVLGIEYVFEAIENARYNAQANNINNSEFFCGKVEDILYKIEKADVAFVNPPRKGCDKAVIEALIALKPRKIVYISCDPATLARDLALLSKYYSFIKAYPFDMFPQTTHVETVIALESIENK